MMAHSHNQTFGRRLRALLILALMLMAAAACSPGQQASADPQPTLRFETKIAVKDATGDGYEVDIALGVKNEGRRAFEGDKQFNAQMKLVNLKTDKLRATANVVSLDRVEAGETAWIMDWNGTLDAGRYRLSWGAEGYDKSAYAEFSVGPENVDESESSSAPSLCPADGEGSDDCVEPDMDARVAQARADLAARLDVSESAITLRDVTEATFPDASLGVPEPGKMYAQVITPGYVIELTVDEQVYTYHAAGERVVFVRTAGEVGEPPTDPTPPDPERANPDPGIREGWQRFADDTYGFALAYPSDWMTKSLAIQGPGTPDDWPMVENVMLFPAEWADRFEQSGPPSPGASPSYPAAMVEVIVGSESQFRRVYPEPTQSERVEHNGTILTTEVDQVSEEIQLIRYVIQDPENPELWIVVNDAVSGFPDRVKGNEAVAATVLPIVESVVFTE